MHTEFRPWFGRALTIAIAVICAIGLVITAVSDGAAATWRFGPWLLLLAGSVWAMYWQPVIEVRSDAVHLVNIVRTIDIPWPCVTAVDTTWSLAFVTEAGRFTAWAAPAPSAVSSMRQARRQRGLMGLGVDRAARYGAAVDPAGHRSAGQTLQLLTQQIQQAWEGARADGIGTDATQVVTVRWHGRVIAIGAALVALGVLAALTA